MIVLKNIMCSTTKWTSVSGFKRLAPEVSTKKGLTVLTVTSSFSAWRYKWIYESPCRSYKQHHWYIPSSATCISCTCTSIGGIAILEARTITLLVSDLTVWNVAHVDWIECWINQSMLDDKCLMYVTEGGNVVGGNVVVMILGDRC